MSGIAGKAATEPCGSSPPREERPALSINAGAGGAVMGKIRMGMAGGGPGAFIGAVHRVAAAIDGQIELVCGAFSSDAQRSISSGRALFLPEQRCYGDYVGMIKKESALPPEQRMQFVAIVTPNFMHFPIAKLALEHGFHVMSDKPATFSLKECLELRDIVSTSVLLYAHTLTFTVYPMV